MKRRGKALLSVLALAGLVGLAPVGASAQVPPPLQGVGSAASAPVVQAISRAAEVSGLRPIDSMRAIGERHPDARCATPEATARASLLRSQGALDGCVDFASTSIAADSAEKTTPGLLYVPFARDTMTFAIAAQSAVPRELSRRELQAIYTCETQGFTPLLPRAGSELRQRWLTFVGLSEAAVAAGQYPCLSDRTSGLPVEENDARVLGPTSLVPFSGANYIAQKGWVVPDLSSNADLGTVTDMGAGGPPVLANDGPYGDVTFALADSSDVAVYLSPRQLRDIYTCRARDITPMLPPDGWVRTAWLSRLNIAESAVVHNVYPCIVTAVDGVPIPENDARVLTARSVVPFSLRAYADQTTGAAPDVRASSTLGVIAEAGETPALPLRLNPAPAGALTHDVYNLVPARAASAADVRGVFIGPDSLVCQQELVIESFGYATLVGDDGSRCGSIAFDTSSTGAPTGPTTPPPPPATTPPPPPATTPPPPPATTPPPAGPDSGVNPVRPADGSRLPAKVMPGFLPQWLNIPRLVDINRNYNMLILFAAQPVGGVGGSTGAVYWPGVGDERGANSNLIADIKTCRARGQKVILSVGGARAQIDLTTRARSQAFVDSLVSIYHQLGGIDGFDWNTYEGRAPIASEYVWVAQQLRSRLGNHIILTTPPAPWSAYDRGFARTLVEADALDLVMPQYYDGPGLAEQAYIEGSIVLWASFVGYDHLAVLFGEAGGAANYMTPAAINSTYAAVEAAHPSIRGGGLWEIYSDFAQGYPVATTLGPRVHS